MSKKPVRVAVTGAAGQIGYALLFRIASGEMLGKDQPVILQLLEIPDEKAQKALKGVMMELEDCAFPLLAGMEAHSDPMTAFKDTDYALLVGSRPRGPGMERAELLAVNGAIFTAQGKALNAVASRNVKVLVVGNPANTNAYIAMKSAPDLPRKNFTAMLRLDHNRALSQIAAKTGKAVADIEKLTVWGNHSPTMYADYRFATIKGESVAKMINDQEWNANVFLPTVGKRGAAIIEARGLSSAASAANAAIDHMRDWALGTNGKWVTMGIPSDGQYGIPKDVMFGFPVTCARRRVQAGRRPGHRRVQPADASTRPWTSCWTSRTASSTCCKSTRRRHGPSARHPPRRPGRGRLPAGLRPLQRRRGAHAQEPATAGRDDGRVRRLRLRRLARLRGRRAGRWRARPCPDGGGTGQRGAGGRPPGGPAGGAARRGARASGGPCGLRG